MGLWNFIAANWGLITANPAPFITVALLSAAIGWGAAAFLYKHRIETQKERVDHLKEKLADTEKRLSAVVAEAATKTPAEVPAFDYPEAGFYGANILSEGTPETFVDREYSLAATVPPGGKLRVHLVGPRPTYIGDNMGAWVFSVPPRNWIATTYDQEAQAQWFEAAPGAADLKFIPKRAGLIQMTVYEGGRDPAWTKAIRVRER